MSSIGMSPAEIANRPRDRYEDTKARLEKYGEEAYPKWQLKEMKRLIKQYEADEVVRKWKMNAVQDILDFQRISENE